MDQRFTKINRQRVVFFILASVGFAVLVFAAGLPVLLNLSSLISAKFRPVQKQTSETVIAPTVPKLAESYAATSSAKIKISGVADPKTTVELSQNDRSLGTNVTGNDGTFSWDIILDRGDNVFVAQAIAENGRKSQLSAQYSIRYLSGSPKLDISTPKDGEAVKNTPVIVSGQTDPGNNVTINDRLVIVNDKGEFSYSLDLPGGENKIKITASDPAGNQTTLVRSITIP